MPLFQTIAARRHAPHRAPRPRRLGRDDGDARGEVVRASRHPPILQPIWRATAPRPSGAACTTAARRSASPSARPRAPMTGSSCRKTAGCRCCCSVRIPPRGFARPPAWTPASPCAASSSLSIPGTGPIVVKGTVDGPFADRDLASEPGDHVRRRHADGDARSARGAGGHAEPVASAGEQASRARHPPRVDRARPGDPAERQGVAFASATAPSSAPTTRSCRRSASTWIFVGCRRRRG